MQQSQLIDPNTPHRVTAPGGHSKLLVMDRKEGFPSTFALLATTSARKVCVRVSGGCKGMGPEDKSQMLEFFAQAFHGFDGLIWSGATRQTTNDGQLDPMVTDVPGVVAAHNSGCVALGSAPRTDIMRLVGDSRLVLDGSGTGPNPSMTGILVVQNGADGASDWDGDVDAAFALMTNLREFAGFSQAGVVAWNGGPITQDEVLRSAKKGWPTIVVKGSGRVSDEIAAKVEAADAEFLGTLPKNHKLVVADKSDPASLRHFLVEFGFLASN